MEKSIKKQSLVLGAVLLTLALFFTSFSSLSFAEEDVTSNIQFINSRLYYDRGTKQSYLDVQIKNISPTVTLIAPIKVVIESIVPNAVTVANPDGNPPGGKPYFYYDVTLSPGQTSTSKRWKFSNPGQLRFNYSVRVLASTPPVNTPPVANAGPDQTVYTAQSVQLNGAGSTDADGNPLTYSWSFVSKPTGSTGVLSNPTIVNPTFVVDKFGDYVVQLIVNDGMVNSVPDTVTVSTTNSKPIANAGPDQTIHAYRETVYLNGSGSSDVDGDPLTYAWSFTSKPGGSSAILFGENTATPSFTADALGNYVIQLIVNDGKVNSNPDTITVSTENSKPVAEAGPNQNVLVGSTVTLDGSASSDADGDPITYSWSLTSKPSGSTAALLNPTAVNPSFNADLIGTYVIQLIVNDGWEPSDPDTVTVTTSTIPNKAPVANAGPDHAAPVTTTVILDGSASYDPDADPLTYSWSFVSQPSGSAAVLNNPTTAGPTFVIDKAGTYIVQLTVNDGKVNSAPDTVTITTQNTAPVANAGPDQTAYVTHTVTLDGSGSSDVDGNPLTYSWSFVSQPAGSGATLSDPTAAKPTFVVDKFGSYTVQLVVNDGTVNSAPDTVVITTLNSAPVANAGPDQTPYVNNTVTLDGSGSSDVDGDPLTYSWSILTKPAGSTAALSDPTAAKPTFVIDKAGTYIVQLTVNDGKVNSAPDTVNITTLNSPPVANAGPDQTVFTKQLVHLSGAGSTDVDGDALTYSWSILTKPAGSTAVLSNATIVNPTFTADKFGNYEVQLIVNDGLVNSAPDTVKVSTTNSAPVANAGPDQTIHAGGTATLSGSGSSDVDGDPLTYAWLITSKPSGSAAALSNPTAVNPTFTADKVGDYVIQLIVNDGLVNSAPDTVKVSTTNSAPVANPGAPQSVTVGTPVNLDGKDSYDADNDHITYSWSFTTRPAGSNAVLTGENTQTPSFVPDLAGIYVVQLIVNDGFVNSLPVTVEITANTAAPTTITLTPSPGQMVTNSTLTMTVTLDNAAGTGGQVVNLSANNSKVTVPATMTVPAGQLSATFNATSGLELGAAIVTASATGLTSSTSSVTVIGRDFTLYSPLVGLNRTVVGSITLAQPAPAGGASFLMSVADTTIATVSPATVTIPAGQSSGNFELTGYAKIGITTVTANGTASGYGTKSLEITVTNRLIDVPSSRELYLGQTVTIPILIAPDAAPTGGTQISVVSNDPSLVEVLTPTVTIPQGLFETSATIRAATAKKGTAEITASNPSYAPDRMQVNVTTALNIIETFTDFPSTGTGSVYIRLESGGQPFNALVNETVALQSTDTTCVSVPSSMTVAAGQSLGTAALSYGGSAALPCTATVTATSTLFGTDTVAVTVGKTPDLGGMTLTDPWTGAYRVGSSLQGQLRLTLATGSHGGVNVQIVSNSPSLAHVSPNATTPGAPVTEFFIPNGQTYYDFYMQGVRGATGDVTLTAKSPRFTNGTVTIKVVQPVFRLYSLDTTTTTLSADDEFYVYAGVLNTAGTGVWFWQTVSAAGPLPVTFTSSNTAVGQIKKTGASGGSITVELPVNREYTSTTVASGGVSFDALGAGTTVVAATAPGFNNAWSEASTTVTVSQPGMTITDPWTGAYRVGSSLQGQLRLTLGGSSHGGVTVQVTSSDPTKVKLSPDATTAGTASINIALANGESYKDFYMQGVREAASGDVTITATQALFTNGTTTVKLVQPVFRLYSLDTTTTTLSADDEFYVYAGVLNTAGTGVWFWQTVSAAGPLPVTFTSSNTAVGQIKKTGASGGSITVELPVNREYTSTTVASGGVSFDALGAGTTVVAATAPGFNNAWSEASTTVTVSQPGMTITDPWTGAYRVGSSLQGQLRLTLGGSSHGGVTVQVTSSDPTKVKLSPDATTAGTASINIALANGESYKDFYMQGVREAASGDVTITATQALFTNGTTTVKLVQPVFRLYSLDTTTTTLSADDEFYVYAGVLNTAGTGVWFWQTVSAAGPLPVTFTSSNTAVGQIKKTGASGGSITVELPVNREYTSTTVASGGVSFDALGAGTTVVAATAPGFNNAWSEASTTVTVSQPGMTITDPWTGAYRVGSSLQGQLRLTLGGSSHGGVTVQVTSSDPTKVKLSPDATTAGTASINIALANGESYKDFYMQGVREAASGDVTITATQALFTNGTTTVKLVQPVFRLYSLDTTTTTLSADDEFYAYAGVLNTAGTSIWFWQPVSAAGPLPVTFTSSNTAVGQIKKTGASGGSITVEIPVNREYSSTTVATGGVAFDALGAGTTVVAATAPGFNNAWSEASATVTVSQPGMTITDPWVGAYRVGSSLQAQLRLTLGGSSHGGVTVRIASGDTLRLMVSPNATTVGTAFIDLFIPDGQTYTDFYMQGKQGITGDVTVTASSPLFVDGTTTIKVVQPVFRIENLTTSTTTSAADDPFWVRTGILNTGGTGIWAWQDVSASGPVQVLFNSSNSAVGQVRTAAEVGSSVTVAISENTQTSPATVLAGGVAFDALTTGSTVISASSIGFDNSWGEASATITVSP